MRYSSAARGEGAVGGRQKTNKASVFIAAQADGSAFGRIRMRMIADASAAGLHLFALDCSQGASRTPTAGRAILGLEQKGFAREVSIPLQSSDIEEPRQTVLPAHAAGRQHSSGHL